MAGRNEWPKNVTDAHNRLSKWEGEGNAPPANYQDYEGVSFMTDNGTKEPEVLASKDDVP